MKNQASLTKTLILFSLFCTLLYWTSVFDYHQWLLPRPEQALMLCRLTNITLDHNKTITDRPDGYVSKGGGEVAKMYFYATSLWKRVSCWYPNSPEEHSSSFIYHNLYIDILRVDLDWEIEKSRAKYAQFEGGVRQRWRYNRERYGYLLDGVNLDRHGFIDQPVDIYLQYIPWFLVGWSAIVISSLLLTSLTVACLSHLSQRRSRSFSPLFSQAEEDEYEA